MTGNRVEEPRRKAGLLFASHADAVVKRRVTRWRTLTARYLAPAKDSDAVIVAECERMRGLSWKAHRILIASRQTEKKIPMHTARRESFAESGFFATKETVVNPICTALVPALQVHCGSWWDSGSGRTYGGYGGSYSGGSWS